MSELKDCIGKTKEKHIAVVVSSHNDISSEFLARLSNMAHHTEHRLSILCADGHNGYENKNAGIATALAENKENKIPITHILVLDVNAKIDCNILNFSLEQTKDIVDGIGFLLIEVEAFKFLHDTRAFKSTYLLDISDTPIINSLINNFGRSIENTNEAIHENIYFCAMALTNGLKIVRDSSKTNDERH